MGDARACQSYQSSETICSDGFIQKPICSGHGGCFTCGHHSEGSVPYCMMEELPPHWQRENGESIFNRSKAKEDKQNG